MKKLLVAFAFAAAVFAACAKQEQPAEMQAPVMDQAQDAGMSVSTTTAEVPAQ